VGPGGRGALRPARAPERSGSDRDLLIGDGLEHVTRRHDAEQPVTLDDQGRPFRDRRAARSARPDRGAGRRRRSGDRRRDARGRDHRRGRRAARDVGIRGAQAPADAAAAGGEGVSGGGMPAVWQRPDGPASWRRGVGRGVRSHGHSRHCEPPKAARQSCVREDASSARWESLPCDVTTHEAEGNCVAARRGGEQPEANGQPAG